jgi:HTH-like domain
MTTATLASATARRRAKIITHIQAAYRLGRGAYGIRRVHAVLRSDDPQVAPVSLKLVRAVMAELGLAASQPRGYKTTTRPDPDATAQPADLVGRDFTTDTMGKLVGDITYIKPAGLAVPGHGDRLLHPGRCSAGRGGSYARQPGLRCDLDGGGTWRLATRCRISFRPRHSIHQCRI